MAWALGLLVAGLGPWHSAGAAETSVYPVVTAPVALLDAFTAEPDASAAQSQAAFLLVVANLLRSRAHDACIKLPHEDMAPPEDLAALGVPLSIYKLEGKWTTRYPLGKLEAELRRRGFVAAATVNGRSDPRLGAELRSLAVELLAEPGRRAAALLAVHSLQHPDPLVRVAAATAASEVVRGGRHLARETLRGSAREGDLLVRMLAATCLARLAPRDPLLDQLAEATPAPSGHEPIRSSTIVHGTWAARGDWWRPPGDFHGYLRAGVALDLYAGDDPFGWSGAWKNSARKRAAEELADWAATHQAPCLNLFAHSHGANLAMLATHRGLRIGRLVLLSCPVHWTKYQPKPGSIAGAVSIRTRLDLVILGDAGGQRFPRHSGIREVVLPVWFSHFVSHDPKVWQERQLQVELPAQGCPHAASQ